MKVTLHGQVPEINYKGDDFISKGSSIFSTYGKSLVSLTLIVV